MQNIFFSFFIQLQEELAAQEAEKENAQKSKGKKEKKTDKGKKGKEKGKGEEVSRSLFCIFF